MIWGIQCNHTYHSFMFTMHSLQNKCSCGLCAHPMGLNLWYVRHWREPMTTITKIKVKVRWEVKWKVGRPSILPLNLSDWMTRFDFFYCRLIDQAENSLLHTRLAEEELKCRKLTIYSVRFKAFHFFCNQTIWNIWHIWHTTYHLPSSANYEYL